MKEALSEGERGGEERVRGRRRRRNKRLKILRNNVQSKSLLRKMRREKEMSGVCLT